MPFIKQPISSREDLHDAVESGLVLPWMWGVGLMSEVG
jgi:hypothetical protein